ncbi:multifunctional CCA tRNA nucleotidyl transferase/2'3'-cyclic phosphodiesterase/2'nucleotidase/phosphatase [Ferrovum sp.]|uniref:multifunctional CCA tRNA nucleotidyl transferase/2'3'-cyclic phosphodiesterase/2'nucleotidase/phosphatase n=1 Tax=Ferrovum sp. TaxID=2609467 RepID=UPI002627BF44|nr:multifunctional CCA tRNA nucleotidyl transferase/2'3'-cyclic phosphodiesterase/2'nucleotidase/phosphatase [Ferrovum sp.]
MQIYEVGGALRDELLGLPSTDRDWVVVGATPEEMEARGFQPVGRDFPVFLHPVTHEEYALARTERKTAPGYRGFTLHADPMVTLEEDLKRRDLTLNAMARDPNHRLIDPYGGLADLENRTLRHVSPAFSEDPVRLLRVARFLAKLAPFDFAVAPETIALLQHMVNNGEVDALVPERILQELNKGMETANPARMFAALAEWGALKKFFPAIDTLWIHTGDLAKNAVDHAAQSQLGQPLRWAAWISALFHGSSLEIWRPLLETWSRNLRWSKEQHQWVELSCALGPASRHLSPQQPEQWLPILEGCDAWRRPQRFLRFLELQECLGEVLKDLQPDLGARGKVALAACQALDLPALVRSAPTPADIPQRMHAARHAALCALPLTQRSGPFRIP